MSKLSYQGPDFNGLADRIVLREHVLRDEAHDVVREVAVEGEALMKTFIEDAETETGRKRAEHGGSPGRIDTGLMHRDTNSHTFDEGDLVVGEFGWPSPADYFLYQEDGTAFIAPMHALLRAFIAQREKLAERIRLLNWRA